MRWLRSIVRETAGLFVDDGNFAVAILVWMAIAILLLPHGRVPAKWLGPALFGGLACILIESAVRFSRRRLK